MSLEKKKILVVDDNQTLVTHLCIILSRMGYNIFPADNGLEAVRLMKIVMPDLVILDVNMPTMDGMQTLRWIKEDESYCSIPVVMISGDSLGETARKCKELGCADYLAKPLRVDELHYVLQEHIFSPMGWKRRYIRANYNCMVTVVFNGTPYELFTETLSEGGMYIRKVGPFPIGSEVGVVLPVDSSRNLELKGTVIYTKGLYGDEFTIPPGMAVEFKDLTNPDSHALMEMVSKLIAGDIVESPDRNVIRTAPEEMLQHLPRSPRAL